MWPQALLSLPLLGSEKHTLTKPGVKVKMQILFEHWFSLQFQKLWWKDYYKVRRLLKQTHASPPCSLFGILAYHMYLMFMEWAIPPKAFFLITKTYLFKSCLRNCLNCYFVIFCHLKQSMLGIFSSLIQPVSDKTGRSYCQANRQWSPHKWWGLGMICPFIKSPKAARFCGSKDRFVGLGVFFFFGMIHFFPVLASVGNHVPSFSLAL